MAYKRISPQPVVEGGTGAQTFTAHGVLVGEGTSAVAVTAAGTTGQVLTGSTGADPVWASPAASSISITGNSGGALTGNAFTFTGGTTGLTFAGAGSTETLGGTLAIANGGTNATSMTTTDGVVYYDGTRLVTTAVGTAAQVLTSNGAGVAPTFQAAGAGPSTTKVTNFTSSGTWTKATGSMVTEVYIWGGGGGGGSGRKGTSTSSSGGSGGGSGDFVYYKAPSTYFSATETVTIGAGGTGGTAQSSAGTNGNAGGIGGQSLVGKIVTPNSQSLAPNNGAGGITTNTGGGSPGWGITMGVTAEAGNGGGNGGTGAGLSATAASFQSTFYPMGGGGGSGGDSGTARQGGASLALFTQDGITTLIAASAGGIETGTINGTAGGAQFTGNGMVTGGGGGGGGGGQKTGGSAGTGGAGAVPGGGGGGGGGSTSVNSGAGGAGGNGYITIIEYF